MNLEQRVEVLEQEVKLLKAEIQATLLDLQEQLLNNKYPILRAEESMHAAPPAAEAPVAASAVNASPIKRVVLTAPDPDERIDVHPMRTAPTHMADDDIAPPPVVRARPNGHHTAPAPEAPKPSRANWDEEDRPQPRAPRVTEPPKLSRADWDEEDRPQPRAPRVTEPLKPSRADWDEEDYPQPRAPRISEPPKPGRAAPIMQAAPTDAEDADARDWIELESWVSQKVEKLGINRTRELINLYTRQERFSRQERELLLQFVTIYDGAPKTPSAQRPAGSANPVRPTIVPHTRAVVDEIRNELRQKRAAAKNKNETYRLSEQQELVMRLIAGILSAGDEDLPSDSGF